MSFYQCTYFKPEELASLSTIQVLELKGLSKEYVYKLFDSRLLLMLDYLRLEYGPIVINNWYAGGERSECGLRVPGMHHYSPTSQHAFGRAADCLLQVDAQSVRNDFELGHHGLYLMRNQIQVTFERDVSWLHIDTRNNDAMVNFF